jgi:hypothetical protein
VDNDGDALVDGALFFDTTNNVMMVYNLGTTTWLRTTPTSSDQTTINNVNSNISNINTVAGISANVTTVAGISANVTTVAGQTTNLQNVTDNLSAIQNASTNATNAASSATAAASSATAAAASQTAAAASAASAATSYDSFDDRYLGVKASDPTTDNDGDALASGMLYFSSSENIMKVYDGASWIAATSAGNVSLTTFQYTATGGQTTFSGSDDNSATLSYTVNNILVTLNGSLLFNGTDYTATNGTSVVLASGAVASDVLQVTAFKSFTTADMVPASTGGTFAGNVNVTGSVTSDGLIVDGDVNMSDSTPVFTMTDTDGGSANMAVYTGSLVISADSANEYTNRVLQLGVGDKAYFNLDDNGDISFREDTGTTAKFFWDASAESLGIGTSSPSSKLEIVGTGFTDSTIRLQRTDSGENNDAGLQFTANAGANSGHGMGGIWFKNSLDGNAYALIRARTDDATGTSGRLDFITSTSSIGNTTAPSMRIDSSGNLLHGKTVQSIGTVGVTLVNGQITATADGADAIRLNRKSSDGSIIDLRKDGSTVGSIASVGGLIQFGQGNANLKLSNAADAITPANGSGTDNDNALDLGSSSARFDDIHATNGTIQTSDRNEKQDIEELTDAEQRVAVAAKGLLRKFRWRDAVTEKGDEARTHFGIIAQDLQAAFAAEGLDASDYAMFISTTWWETQTEVAAVEAVEAQDAVYNEDGELVTEAVEAVEAKEAYTRIDTYNSEEEAPEGATEKTRMGVRYSELLAFIIAAI